MSTFLYNNARHLFATKQINWTAETVNAMLVNALYSPSPSQDQYVSAIPSSAIIVRDALLSSLTEAAGICGGIIPEFEALAAPTAAVAVVLYVNTGTDGTSPLIYYSSDGAGFPFTPQGFNYFVSQDQGAGGWFQV